MACGDSEGSIKLRDAQVGGLIDRLTCGSQVSALAFSPDGTRLASGADDGEVRLWDLASRQFQSLEGHQGTIATLGFSPDGRFLVAPRGWRGQGQSIVWDVSGTTATRVTALEEEHPIPWAMAFTADSRIMAIGGQSNAVFLYDTATWRKFWSSRPLGCRLMPWRFLQTRRLC